MVQANTGDAVANNVAAGQSDIMLKKALIERKLDESGEKARLEEFLRQRLIESGWRDDLKRHCLGKFQTLSDLSIIYAQQFFFPFKFVNV